MTSYSLRAMLLVLLMLRHNFISTLILCIGELWSTFWALSLPSDQSKLVLSRGKYVLDILMETRLLGCKPQSFPTDSKANFLETTSPLLVDVYSYYLLVGKHIYLISRCPNITYMVLFSASLCMRPRRFIFMVLFVYSHISSMLLDLALFINGTVLLPRRPSLV